MKVRFYGLEEMAFELKEKGITEVRYAVTQKQDADKKHGIPYLHFYITVTATDNVHLYEFAYGFGTVMAAWNDRHKPQSEEAQARIKELNDKWISAVKENFGSFTLRAGSVFELPNEQ